jgi:hypothetical protein
LWLAKSIGELAIRVFREAIEDALTRLESAQLKCLLPPSKKSQPGRRYDPSQYNELDMEGVHFNC